MAKRRMFSKDITEHDNFLDMPLSSQALYFHLGMQADDDGFVSPKRIMRMVGSQTDDLNILIAKKFVLQFEDGVVVIKHWKINNYIQADRKKDTLHTEKFALLTTKENGGYKLDTECIQDVRVGKDRVGKESINTQSKIASNKKLMYQETTIELDENGEEIQCPKKKTTFGRYPGKIAKAYCELTGKRSASRQLPSAKELMQICQEDFPGKSMEEWYDEIIKRMKKLKEQYDKNDIKDWNLSKLAEHWELKKEEIKKDVADRRIL